MKTSESIKTLSGALLKAQKEIHAAVKGAENPFFKSKYADLTSVIEAVKEPLNNHGISFLQAVGNGDGLPHVETILLHETGEFISTITPVYCAKQNDPQAFGSGVTYSKRYSLQALLGLPTEDDDGEGAMARGKKAEPPQPKPKVDLEKLKSKDGVKWLKGFGSAQAAITRLRQDKEITVDVEAFINELFETEAGSAKGATAA